MLGDVGAIELAHPVFRETGPQADGVGAGLVTDQAQREVEAHAVAAVAVVGDAHVYPLHVTPKTDLVQISQICAWL